MKYAQLLAAASCLTLVACSGNNTKEFLGLQRSAPDEYRVVSRPPLSMPPQFALRPPSATDSGPAQVEASRQAEVILLGNEASPQAGGKEAKMAAIAPASGGSIKASGAEAQFLRNAGVDNADPQVRNRLVEEKFIVQEKKDESSWWNPFPEEREPIVDAKKEAERIDKNEEQGKPASEGEIAEVKPRDTGVLGRWLGY